MPPFAFSAPSRDRLCTSVLPEVDKTTLKAPVFMVMVLAEASWVRETGAAGSGGVPREMVTEEGAMLAGRAWPVHLRVPEGQLGGRGQQESRKKRRVRGGVR